MEPRSVIHRKAANDRFKQQFGRWMWAGVMVAAVFHFALFQYFPKLTAKDISTDIRWTEPVLPPEIDIPAPPQSIKRPQIPVVARVDPGKEVIVPRIEPRHDPIPLPALEDPSVRSGGGFAVYTLAPRIKDRPRAMQIVERHYPRLLKDAGIGGRVLVEAHIDTAGRVVEVNVLAGSGVAALDAAALAAVRLFEYTPALNRDMKVAVWIMQSIEFTLK